MLEAGRRAMSGRRLVFVNHPADAGTPADDTEYLVLDAAWTGTADDRPDLLPIRGPLWDVLRDRDVHREALAALDDWAERAGMATRLQVGGISWWYHVRGFIRLDLHEMLLWLRVLEVIAPHGRYDRIEVPRDRPWLLAAVEAAQAGGAPAGTDGAEVVERQSAIEAPRFRGGKPASSTTSRRRRWLVRITARSLRTVRRVLDVPGRARARLQRERLVRLVHGRPAVLAVVRRDSFHQVDGPDGGARSDPLVTPVLRRLAELDRSAATVILGNVPDGEERGLRDALMPIDALTSLLTSKAERRDSREDLAGRLEGIGDVALPVGGADLGPALVTILSGLDRWFARQRRELLVAERVLGTLKPRVLVTGWEASRTAWLEAARARGVPTVAIQHGVIYPSSPDYYRRPGPGLVRPTVMCVYGAYERRLLVEECGYPPSTVIATGSPRVSSEVAPGPADQDIRAQLRRSLGLGESEQMLLLTGARHAVGEGLVSTTIYAQLLNGELPGIHLVVKLHPEEDQADHYLALIEGLARAGGWRPPPVTVVRHVDLFQLLQAADAHLGIYSTVLTDGVVAGTPTMVATGQAWSDLVGYAVAGVAQAVTSVEDVRRFMREPWVPSRDVRDAFVREHSEPGDGAARIAGIVDALAAQRGRESPSATSSGATTTKSPAVRREGGA
jgi:hypothetical protein